MLETELEPAQAPPHGPSHVLHCKLVQHLTKTFIQGQNHERQVYKTCTCYTRVTFAICLGARIVIMDLISNGERLN
jgi:hypothetical protein